jgi:DNA-binding CsgD family transcriptional regulator
MGLKNKIIELRENGKSYNEISDILNCSKGVISYHCSGMNSNDSIIRRNTKKKNENQRNVYDVVIIDEIIKLKNDSRTFKEISTLLGITIDDVSKICRKYEIKNSKISIGDKCKIVELFNINNNISETSRVLNISRYTISNYLDSVGIKHRKCDDKQLRENKKNVIKKWRNRVKSKLVDYMGGECVKCGYNRCLSALEFHHLDPTQKDFSISSKGWSFERLKSEVNKCILVCKNCHMEIHEELRNMVL